MQSRLTCNNYFLCQTQDWRLSGHILRKTKTAQRGIHFSIILPIAMGPLQEPKFSCLCYHGIGGEQV